MPAKYSNYQSQVALCLAIYSQCSHPLHEQYYLSIDIAPVTKAWEGSNEQATYS